MDLQSDSNSGKQDSQGKLGLLEFLALLEHLELLELLGLHQLNRNKLITAFDHSYLFLVANLRYEPNF